MSGQYFENEPSVASDPKKVSLTIADNEYIFTTDRGVFSYEKVDKATRILLNAFLEKYDGSIPETIIDVGSGYGPISVVVAKHFKDASQIVGVEPNERAQTLSLQNYQSNIGDDRFDVVSPQNFDIELKPDLIISNPPVRIGKKEMYELLSFWAKQLADGGQMWLVIAKNLGADTAAIFLEKDCGLEVSRVASKNGFRVLCCKKPD